jgi:hypothetical protein
MIKYSPLFILIENNNTENKTKDEPAEDEKHLK